MKSEDEIRKEIEIYKQKMNSCFLAWDLNRAGRIFERIHILEWVLEEDNQSGGVGND